MLFEEHGIASIGTESSVCQIAKDGHETNKEIQHDVEQHFDFDTIRQPALYAGACSHYHEGK